MYDVGGWRQLQLGTCSMPTSTHTGRHHGGGRQLAGEAFQQLMAQGMADLALHHSIQFSPMGFFSCDTVMVILLVLGLS